DVVHLIKSCGPTLDWGRLLRRFGPHWEVLLSHLLLFRYAYPGERSHVPAGVTNELIDRLLETVGAGDEPTGICRGTLLSRYNYVLEVEKWGYVSARTGGARRE